MKTAVLLLCLLSSMLFVGCETSKKDLKNTLQEPEIQQEKIEIDYRFADCDSIKALFKVAYLNLGDRENRILEYYQCKNAQDIGKFQKEVDLFSKFRTVSNEGKGVIIALDEQYNYHMFNDKLDVLLENEPYISHFYNDLALIKYDTFFKQEVTYYTPNEEIRREEVFRSYERIINRKGEFINDDKYDEILFMFHNNLARTRKILDWGIVNSNGKILVEHKYREIGNVLGDSIAILRLRRKWGAIDLKTKKILFKFKYYKENEVDNAVKRLHASNMRRK